MLDMTSCLAELRAQSLLPEHYDAVFVVGSVAMGWANPNSDVDIYIISPDPWRGRVDDQVQVLLEPAAVPVVGIWVDGRRWEIKYWLRDHLEQMLAKVAEPEQSADELSRTEFLLLGRLQTALCIDGADWLARMQDRVRSSAFRSIAVRNSLGLMDKCTEDAVGTLEADDLDCAVMAARLAFSHAVEALLDSLGAHGSVKWQPRRFRAAQPQTLSYEEYWAIETMRSFEPSNARTWVESVLGTCHHISLQVRL